MKIAVVGAGLAGLVVARRLGQIADVTVFEKSRGTGGRMSTRYAGDYEFDHGAQYFTARGDAFSSFLKPLVESGVVGEWTAEFVRFDGSARVSMPTQAATGRYVGTPRMNSIGKALAEGLQVSLKTTVASTLKGPDGWTLKTADGIEKGPYDWLIMAAPAEQTAALIPASPELAAFCADRPMTGCFALMLGFEKDLQIPWQAAQVSNSSVSWIAVNSSKPGRPDLPFTLVIQSTNAWAESHMEDPAEGVMTQLLDEGSDIVGADLRQAAHHQLHRWRYANAEAQSGSPYFLDVDAGLAACGDWCLRGRIEEAFTSAQKLADAMIERSA